jgi:hypothetical protein
MITPCRSGLQLVDEKDRAYVNELVRLENSRANKTINEGKWRCIGEYCKKFPCDLMTAEEIGAAPVRLPEGI